MSKFVIMTSRRDYYYKLPYGIETLDDERVDEYTVKYETLLLKLKDNDKVFEIDPTYKEDGEIIDDKELEYCDEEETPFYESDEEESDSDEEALCPELDKLSLQIEKQHYENVKLDEIDD